MTCTSCSSTWIPKVSCMSQHDETGVHVSTVHAHTHTHMHVCVHVCVHACVYRQRRRERKIGWWTWTESLQSSSNSLSWTKTWIKTCQLVFLAVVWAFDFISERFSFRKPGTFGIHNRLACANLKVQLRIACERWSKISSGVNPLRAFQTCLVQTEIWYLARRLRISSRACIETGLE